MSARGIILSSKYTIREIHPGDWEYMIMTVLMIVRVISYSVMPAKQLLLNLTFFASLYFLFGICD